MAAARFAIRGRVQGVWFRAATREQALALDLHGEAINLPDGSVQVLVAGDDAALDALGDWLRIGPPDARVHEVVRSAADPAEAGVGFSIG